MWEVPWASGPGRGARGTPLSVGVWEPRGRRAPVPPATLRVPDWDWAVLPGVCLRWPLLGLWPHLPVLLCVLVSLTLSTRPPPPRRRVSGSGAPRAAPAQRGAAPAEAAGPPARPAEPLLLCHPGGELRAPGHESAAAVLFLVAQGRGLRLPAAPGAARLGVPVRQLRDSLGIVVSSGSGLRGGAVPWVGESAGLDSLC